MMQSHNKTSPARILLHFCMLGRALDYSYIAIVKSPSVGPHVCHALVLYQKDQSKDHNVFPADRSKP